MKTRQQIEQLFTGRSTNIGAFLCHLNIGFEKLWKDIGFNPEQYQVVEQYMPGGEDETEPEEAYLLRALTLNIYLDDNNLHD